MKLDFGEILTSAWRIIWKHKSIWGISFIPVLLSFFVLPLLLGPIYLIDETSNGSDTIYMAVFFLSMAVFAAISLVVSAYTRSAATLGVLRADRGEGSTSFADLLRDGAPYFGRILSVDLLIGFTIGAVFTIFFLCVFISSMVTMGLAAICLQPIMIVISPLMWLVLAGMEAAETSVILEETGPGEAVKRTYRVIRENFWTYVVVTLVVFLGGSIASSLLSIPLSIPFGMIAFFTSSPNGGNPDILLPIFIGSMCLFFPLMMLVQSIVMTYTKAALVLTYKRLSSPGENDVVFHEETA